MEHWKNSTRLRWLAVGALALAAEWTFYAQAIAPFRQQKSEADRGVAALKGQIEDARRVVGEVREMEAQTGIERGKLRSLHGGLPLGPALVWFPELMQKHFADFGVEVATRLNTALDVPELPGFEQSYFAVELPVKSDAKGTSAACLSIAEIEPLNQSIRVLDAAIRPDADDPSRHLVVINVAVLSPKASR